MDARERVRRARQADLPSSDPETLAESENVREQMSVQHWITNSLGPALGSIREELQTLQRNQNEGLSRIQGDLTYLASAIAKSQQERRSERWMAAAICTAIALVAGLIAGVIAPRISPESQRLQRLGTSVEASWQAMSPADRRQLEKLLGWTRPTEPDAR